jgi:hypothetical protein
MLSVKPVSRRTWQGGERRPLLEDLDSDSDSDSDSGSGSGSDGGSSAEECLLFRVT